MTVVAQRVTGKLTQAYEGSAAHNKRQTDARGLRLASYYEFNDVVKLLLAGALAQWFLVSVVGGV